MPIFGPGILDDTFHSSRDPRRHSLLSGHDGAVILDEIMMFLMHVIKITTSERNNPSDRKKRRFTPPLFAQTSSHSSSRSILDEDETTSIVECRCRRDRFVRRIGCIVPTEGNEL